MERQDLQAAIIACTIANANRDPKKQRKPFKLEDFMPKFDRSKPNEVSWKDKLTIVEILNAAFGGKDLRKNGNPGNPGS